ncbi:hypothetical protein [Chelativorans salis]|uniref:Uncharacterized protein n=1 Tax=Chelativorans salis TaxID=2978478 RepID=A0ABT2LJZ7_9HYPH|nr:hypothetical protein [Chelativorans sp. EGI FJ00035]MCT7374843.1 hypothetical protein [Chelativorans sp. EGI FJ00035]
MRALWAGRLPLGEAFWKYALLYGTLASMLATGGALALLAAGMPAAAALAVHFLPLPYLLAAVVGVYRSAARYAGPPLWARTAEVAVVLWAIVMAVL